MSIVYGPLEPGSDDDPERASAVHLVYVPLSSALCFYCIRELSYPLVQWVGAGMIFLHPPCAQDVGMRLIKDGLLSEKNQIAVSRP